MWNLSCLPQSKSEADQNFGPIDMKILFFCVLPFWKSGISVLITLRMNHYVITITGLVFKYAQQPVKEMGKPGQV